MAWASRHPILTWSIAWGLTGIGLITADAFSDPRHGPLWVGVAIGCIAWGVAGAATFNGRRTAGRLIIWGTAYVTALWLGALWANWFEHIRFGPIDGAGFVGALFGWAAGAFCGALLSAWVLTSPRSSIRSVIFALAWSLSFLVAGYVGLVAGMLLSQVSKTVFAFLGNQQVALTIGWGVGAALGGLFASALGMAAHRGFIRSLRAAV
jgi:hypothetical protein